MKTLLRGTAWIAAGLVLAAGAALAVSDAEVSTAQAALQKAPRDDNRRVEAARLLYLRGSDASMAGNHAGAATDFKAGLSTLEVKPSKVSRQNPVYEELRYGLGYTLLQTGQPQEAVVVLDQLVADSPKVSKARYLLGVALMQTATEAGHKRGIEVLSQLGKDSPGADGIASMHAASRYALDASIGMALSGKAPGAVATLSLLRERFGTESGADEAENQSLLYGMGSSQLLAGNPASGLSELETLNGKNPSYRLKNGIAIGQVLSSTYYRSGFEQLTKGTPGSLEQAIASFDNAERIGGGNLADTHHGKALAFKQLRQLDKMAFEMATIQKIDPDYYRKINIGG